MSRDSKSERDDAAQKSDDARRASDYMANERTFLAWVRTSIAVISFGYVTGKLHVILPGLGFHHTNTASTSIPVGIGMIAFGGLLAALAAWRYHVVNLQIERGQVKPDRALIISITALVLALAVAMISYLLAQPETI